MGGYGEYRGNGRDPKVRKLKMPIFEGEDGHGWIYKVERYFAVNGLTDDEKLTAAGLCLEGKALAWYQWRDRREPIRSWREFKDCLLERFRADGGGDFYEQFFALTQEGTVADYRDKFEYLASRLDHISESTLEGNFMKGLKLEIRTAVRVLEPRNLGKAMELAQLVEDQKKAERRGSR
ncbi:1-phosphatidylinositol-3-phosphate 5-kinase [Dendrobium catenatum]|uniref:1-phosphatidylinositol-3-phosphate 5-kinase n=1 Tax=Dendrobium catenatum TaxID=906689 RepID=A0A2I0VV18_9ASPA|nr:1-phosphatidylinositol-3-phosphate 5-kinase [Dendrobium catenatum]